LVYRTALVGVRNGDVTEPVLWVELQSSARGADKGKVRLELLTLAQEFEAARRIKTILFHPSFPTDVRHNSKIIREKLARLAQRRLV
jgi:olefin beta-lactone synthetase